VYRLTENEIKDQVDSNDEILRISEERENQMVQILKKKQSSALKLSMPNTNKQENI
jgi:hypothetical protein